MFFRATIANLGSGIRSIDHQVLPNSALVESTKSIQENAITNTQVSIVRGENTIHQQLGLDVSSHENGVDLFATAKNEMITRIQWDAQKIYVLIRKTLKQSDALGAPVTLSDAAASSIAEVIGSNDATEVFYNIYGDQYISQIDRGAEVVIIAELSTDTSGLYQGVYKQNDSRNKEQQKKERQKLAEKNQEELRKLTVSKDNTSISEIATFAEHSVTNYWIHTAGLENGKTFVPNSTSFPHFLDSVIELLKFDKSVLSTVRLGYQTIGYNSISINKPYVTTQSGEQVTRAQITQYLMNIEKTAQANKPRRLRVIDIENRASFYLNKYDTLVKMIYEKPLDQKEHEEVDREIMNNRQKLYAMIGTLQVKDREILDMFYKGKAEDKLEAIELKQDEEELQKIIVAYPASRAYTPLRKIEISANEQSSGNFKLNYDTSAKYIYIRLHKGSADPGLVQLEMQTAKARCVPCHSAQYKNLFSYSFKAIGDYIPTASIPRDAELRLALTDSKIENSQCKIEILQCHDTPSFNKLAF